MTALEFFAAYVLLLLVCSCAIIGFYIITRGERIKQPDGSFRRVGKILKHWQIFWEEIIGHEKIYYVEDQLSDKIDFLKKTITTFVGRIAISPDHTYAIVPGINDLEIGIIEDTLGCKVQVEDGNKVMLYNEEPIYYWPEFIRYPLSQCPPCMSSVGGTLLYWPFVLFQKNAFDWSHYKDVAFAFYWLIFCIAAATVNRLIHRHVGS